MNNTTNVIGCKYIVEEVKQLDAKGMLKQQKPMVLVNRRKSI